MKKILRNPAGQFAREWIAGEQGRPPSFLAIRRREPSI